MSTSTSFWQDILEKTKLLPRLYKTFKYWLSLNDEKLEKISEARLLKLNLNSMEDYDDKINEIINFVNHCKQASLEKTFKKQLNAFMKGLPNYVKEYLEQGKLLEKKAGESNNLATLAYFDKRLAAAAIMTGMVRLHELVCNQKFYECQYKYAESKDKTDSIVVTPTIINELAKYRPHAIELSKSNLSYLPLYNSYEGMSYPSGWWVYAVTNVSTAVTTAKKFVSGSYTELEEKGVKTINFDDEILNDLNITRDKFNFYIQLAGRLLDGYRLMLVHSVEFNIISQSKKLSEEEKKQQIEKLADMTALSLCKLFGFTEAEAKTQHPTFVEASRTAEGEPQLEVVFLSPYEIIRKNLTHQKGILELTHQFGRSSFSMFYLLERFRSFAIHRAERQVGLVSPEEGLKLEKEKKYDVEVFLSTIENYLEELNSLPEKIENTMKNMNESTLHFLVANEELQDIFKSDRFAKQQFFLFNYPTPTKEEKMISYTNPGFVAFHLLLTKASNLYAEGKNFDPYDEQTKNVIFATAEKLNKMRLVDEGMFTLALSKGINITTDVSPDIIQQPLKIEAVENRLKAIKDKDVIPTRFSKPPYKYVFSVGYPESKIKKLLEEQKQVVDDLTYLKKLENSPLKLFLHDNWPFFFHSTGGILGLLGLLDFFYRRNKLPGFTKLLLGLGLISAPYLINKYLGRSAPDNIYEYGATFSPGSIVFNDKMPNFDLTQLDKETV